MSSRPLQLYGFWRSQATYRLRVALRLKNIPYTENPINLDAGEQYDDSFRSINPLGSVPALIVPSELEHHEVLTQSLAVLEYLEETHPSPSLLPPSSDPLGRARVRSLAAIAVSDSHPLIVPRIREYLKEHAGFDDAMWKGWQRHWFTMALRGFEDRLRHNQRTGKFCEGNEVTMADICLLGCVNGARAFGIEVDDISAVDRIVEECEKLDAFEKAKAKYQADFPAKEQVSEPSSTTTSDRNETDNTSKGPLTLMARYNVGHEWNLKVEALRQRMEHLTGVRDVEFAPNFNANAKQLAPFVTPGNWVEEEYFITSIGAVTFSYFEAFANHLEKQGFRHDSLLREGFQKAVPSKTIGLRIVKSVGNRRAALGEKNETVIENGIVWMQTEASSWKVHVEKIANDWIRKL